MEATGNDFLLTHHDEVQETDWPSLARRWCARHTGLGADGLLAVSSGEIFGPRVRMWNPDGTEDFCGNGIRCAAKFLRDRNLVPSHFMMGTLRTPVGVDVHNSSIAVDLGTPLFAPPDIPIRIESHICPVFDYPLTVDDRILSINSVSTGTTHTVLFCAARPDDAEFIRVSSQLEVCSAFPERTSVLWVTLEDDEHLAMRIWERGVGETMGCGTGAAAAAVVARLQRHTRSPTVVRMPGGTIDVRYEIGERVTISGGAEYVCELNVTDLND
jgi:diaminopimelate epimerase